MHIYIKYLYINIPVPNIISLASFSNIITCYYYIIYNFMLYIITTTLKTTVQVISSKIFKLDSTGLTLLGFLSIAAVY